VRDFVYNVFCFIIIDVGIDMEVYTTDNEVRTVTTAAEEFALFFSHTLELIQECEQHLLESPSHFKQVEQRLSHAFKQGAGMVTAGLLNTTSKDSSVLAPVQDIPQSSETPFRPSVRRSIFIRLLCGVLLKVTTLYCAPNGKQTDTDPTEARAGLYPELAVYGFAKKSSAALEDHVTRRVAFCPSFEVATRELNHEGIDINVKEVRRIALQCGESLLSMRLIMVQAFLAGILMTSNELSGKRVVVELDGGRMKLRKNKVFTRQSKGKHPKYDTDWREPKLLIIYTVDAFGKKEKQSKVWIDGTFQGPDHLAELLATWLYRLGVSDAESVTFIADGAPWIWDRFDWVVTTLKLPRAKVQYVLDFYHAAHHLSLALGELSLEEEERKKCYRELRSDLRHSRWQVVVSRLEKLGRDLLSEEACVFSREWRFIRKHGKSGHLNYTTYTRRGLPLGSGAVESTIRRVINLRLKGNGMFWTLENAESMLQVRCQLLSTEWEVRLDELYRHRLKTRRRKWQWLTEECSKKARNEQKPNKKNAERHQNIRR
jgi:hypothetical protein